MDFELTESQEELKSAVRAVLSERCPPALARSVVETGVLAEQPWRSAVELGWPGVAIAEELGGLGLGFAELALVVEEHGRALAPGPFLATTTQFAPVVREAGDAAQRERFLGAVADGSLTGALAVAGPVGSGLHLDPSLRATRDGDGHRLTGERCFVLDGATADEVVLAAQVEEGDGVGLFVLPRAELRVASVKSLDGSRPLAALALDGVRAGPERTLGRPGASAAALARALEEAVTALAIDVVGTCQALLERVLDHARQRRQFDQPIGAFQAVQHKCTDMYVAIEKARATALFAVMTIVEDDPRSALAASMAKAAAGECEALVSKDAIQIHGGMGFTWESDVQLYVKRAKTGAHLLGTASEHRARIADLMAI
jgi:alkylation response protein AidB-like acyl-CoA dehydrogenase